jgi:hypothetical protein
VNDKVGIGYDPDRLFALQCECLRAEPYEICGQCGQSPHEGECAPNDAEGKVCETIHACIGLN